MAMVYEPLYHAQEIVTTCLLVVLGKRNQQDLAMGFIVFNKTIIPLMVVGYDMIDSQRGANLSSDIRCALVE